jgi:hypothetical protein
MIKSMINNKQNKKSSTDEETKRKRLDKEIYLEAIYQYIINNSFFDYLNFNLNLLVMT